MEVLATELEQELLANPQPSHQQIVEAIIRNYQTRLDMLTWIQSQVADQAGTIHNQTNKL